MCIFSNPILNVFATKIFGRLTDKGTQFIVYKMSYESEVPNAMILPLPTALDAGEDGVRFIDLKEYGEFFSDLAKAFPFRPTGGIGCSASNIKAASDSLVVHEVGDYVASFVPTLDDFERLDPQFAIPRKTWDKIPTYSDYGFVVFQLKKLIADSHPMAFEFETRLDEIFFPTVHIHDGEVHSEEEFEHLLVAQHAGLDSVAGAYINADVVDKRTGFVRSKEPAKRFSNIAKSKGILQADLLLHQKELHGRHKNEDMVFQIAGNPLVPSFNWRKFIWVAPWVFGLGAVAWFFNRRGKIRREKQLTSGDE